MTEKAGAPRRRAGRQALEEAVSRCQRAEARLSDLEEMASVGWWTWDPGTGTGTWSPGMRRLHGLPGASPHTFLAEVLPHVHPADRGMVRGFLDGTRRMPSEFEYRACDALGRECAVVHARTQAAGTGPAPARVRGVAIDVAEERRREGRRREAFMADLVASSPDAMVAKDREGTITSWNHAAEALFGYTAQEAIGRPVTLLFPRERLPEEEAIRKRVLAGQTVAPFETQRLRKDGGLVDVSVSVSPLRDRDGRILGAATVSRDITARKRMMAIEKEVAEAEIRRLAEMARFRARFLNVAAHELKTPMTPIRLQLQILRHHLRDAAAPVLRSVEILSRSVERLRLLMEDVLDAARIQATQLKLKPERMDLGRVVYEALETYVEVAKTQGIQLNLDVPGAVVMEGDATRLLQVASNLLSNALKFTPQGGQVHVQLRSPGDEAVLTVSDSGRGLTAEQRRQLFQPFAQVHPDLEATSKGSGLGLFIVKAIVEQHGGSIRIDSPGPDQGTTVTVRLPLRLRPRAPQRPRGRAAQGRRPKRGKPTHAQLLPRPPGPQA